MTAPQLSAAELYSDGDLILRWDSTLTYSAAFRLAARNRLLLQNINGDDGDRNFAPGPISNRVDLLSRIDIARDGFGVDVSGNAWYDTIYNQRNGNDAPATFNPVSVPHNAFTDETKSLNGRRAEAADAFIHGAGEIGGPPFSFRLGRQTLLWGESLFFPDNGIAGAQAPIDEIREQSQSGEYTRDIFLPLGQAWISLGVTEGLTVETYYQFESRSSRLPGSGSYFSVNDSLDPGGERYLVGPKAYFSQQPDEAAPATGQYGVALRFTEQAIDYGLYVLRFNARTPQLYYRIGAGPASYDPTVAARAVGQVGTYDRVYARGIALYGASASLSIGATNVAAELSARLGAPLLSLPLYVAPRQHADGGDYALYPVGDTLNGNMSSITSLSHSRFWDSASLSTDMAMRWRLAVTRNADVIDTTAKSVALAFRADFEPTYFEVLPHMDLTLRASAAYGILGRLGDDPYQSQGQGAADIEFGATATWRSAWSGTATATHFIGAANRQPFADRDFLSLSFQRSF